MPEPAGSFTHVERSNTSVPLKYEHVEASAAFGLVVRQRCELDFKSSRLMFSPKTQKTLSSPASTRLTVSLNSQICFPSVVNARSEFLSEIKSTPSLSKISRGDSTSVMLNTVLPVAASSAQSFP